MKKSKITNNKFQTTLTHLNYLLSLEKVFNLQIKKLSSLLIQQIK
ncbi:hypothetical protein [Mycoplasma sp. NEAQ87857]|nr:hypothetical protein [Mycoplasma sp. NEAQ87857]